MLFDAPVPYRVLLGEVTENRWVDTDGFTLWTALCSFECRSPMSNTSIVSPANTKGGKVNMKLDNHGSIVCHFNDTTIIFIRHFPFPEDNHEKLTKTWTV